MGAWRLATGGPVGRNRSEEGISSLGAMFSLAALLVVVIIGSIVVSLTLPSTKTTTTTTTASTAAAHEGTNQATSRLQSTTTTVASALGPAAAAEVAACRSDVLDVQTALAAYQASNGSYPTPPAAWTAASYPTNFAPLTNAPAPGPFLKMPPGDNHYVILWDSSGHIWVEPPGTFSRSYDAANNFTNPSTCARVAR
jgi:hypothetical protein